MTHTDFGDGRRYLFVVEGAFGLMAAQQRLLDSLVDEVAAAGETDNAPTGSLFSRLQDDGTVLAGQPAAAATVAFTRYSGQAKFTPEDGQKILLATWEFEVLT